ncbi:MAG: hypothetical protein F7C32_04140, partial [Desulfurococcales archaeon]|nr:hypothetical protein [Desulfurococcales archaeon]
MNRSRTGISSLIGAVLMIVIMINLTYIYSGYIDEKTEIYSSYLDSKIKEVKLSSVKAEQISDSIIVVSNPTEYEIKLKELVYENGQKESLNQTILPGASIAIKINSTSEPRYIVLNNGYFIAIDNLQNSNLFTSSTCVQYSYPIMVYDVSPKVIPVDSEILFLGDKLIENTNYYISYDNY